MRYELLTIRVLALIALAVSAAQLADRLSGAGAFCAFEGDCDVVTASAYGRPLGIPLSAIGVIGFALLFSLTMLPRGRGFRLVRPFAIAAGIGGGGLLVIQFALLGRVCPLCVVVDVCALGLALAVLVRRPEASPPVRLAFLGWIVAAVAAAFVPVLWSLSELPPPPPDAVKALWQPGRVTVVELTDFDCPHCARADLVLKEVLPGHDVRFVRVVVPMPNHENARAAGRAYLAAVRQGRGDEMAAALFSADSRASARCRELAVALGLNLTEYDKDVGDFALDADFNATLAWSKNLGMGLPLIWVQDRLLQGVPTHEELDAAIRRAKPFQP